MMSASSTCPDRGGRRAVDRSTPREILFIFARLGLTCFGGPIAHIGYFRDAFVVRRRWLDERAYADLVALCQFLPGPASSQVGFSLGLLRGGYAGGLAAWLGFTLPSAIALVLFAYGAGALGGPAGTGLLHGLKLVAVAIVAQAVLGMARSLCPDRPRASIAVLALGLMMFAPGAASQLGAIALGAAAGLAFCRDGTAAAGDGRCGARLAPDGPAVSRRILRAAGAVVRAAPRSGALALFAAFYRSGALVFGGGHVVLPLLRDAVVAPGWVSDSAFLAGYGAAQAVPGPLFTFAAYLGAVASMPPGGVAGAAVALVAIFVPGLLALLGTLPFWHALRGRAGAQAAMRGVNAAVVGLLGAALYDPVWISAVRGPADFAVAAAGFVLLVAWGAAPLLVVLLSAASGVALAMLG